MADKHIEKAELERDLAQLIAQSTMINGVIQYVQGKIKQLEKEVSNGDNSPVGA